jgi:ABC-type transport system involved in multi-copper enzyme maturation permease subunit
MRPQVFAQLAAIARYDMLIQWRRGNLKMILVLLVLAPPVLILLGTAPDSAAHQALALATETTRPTITTDVAVLATFALIPLVLFGLPLFTAETIPYDRQYGIRDLLDALPMGWGVYLVGKVLAVWVGVLAALALSGLITGVLCTLVYGVLDPKTWVVLWAGGFLIFGLMTSAISILLAVGQPGRRRALLVGLLCLPAYLVVYTISPLGVYSLASLNRVFITQMNRDAAQFIPQSADPATWTSVLYSLLAVALACDERVNQMVRMS